MSIPIVLVIGAGIGAVNGLLVAVLRYQPVIATLCVFFILAGLADKIAPTPTPASANWTVHLGGEVGPIPGRCSPSPFRSWCGHCCAGRRFTGS